MRFRCDQCHIGERVELQPILTNPKVFDEKPTALVAKKCTVLPRSAEERKECRPVDHGSRCAITRQGGRFGIKLLLAAAMNGVKPTRMHNILSAVGCELPMDSMINSGA